MARILVPLSAETFGHHEVTLAERISVERQLVSIGREVLGRALSIDFIWGARDDRTIITKPVSDAGYATSALSRLLYEGRYAIPSIQNGEIHHEIYDLNRPSVAIRNLGSIE